MFGSSTMGLADLYGTTAPNNHSENKPPDSQANSGGNNRDARPAFSWVAVLVLLVVLRIIIDMKERG